MHHVENYLKKTEYSSTTVKIYILNTIIHYKK